MASDFINRVFPAFGRKSGAVLFHAGRTTPLVATFSESRRKTVLTPVPSMGDDDKNRSFSRGAVFASIPRRLLLMRQISIPATGANEIENMVSFEVGNLIPYAPRETVYDYLVLNTTDEGYSDILVAGIQRKKLTAHMDRIREWGLDPDYVAPSSLALQKVLAVICSDVPDRPAILLDVDSEGVESLAVKDGQLLFSRDVVVSPERVAPQGANGGGCSAEVVRSVQIATERLHGFIPSVFLKAPPDMTDGLLKSLSDELEVEAEVVDEQSILEQTRMVVYGKETEGYDAPAISLTLIGLALMARERAVPDMNLLPEEIKAERAKRSKRRYLAKVGAFALLFTVSLFCAANGALTRKARNIALLEAEIRKINPVAKEVEKKRVELKLIKEQLAGHFSPFNLIMELYKLTPDGVTLSNASVDCDRGITIRGQARALSQAFSYLATLEDSEFFVMAETRYAEKRPVGDKEIVDFEICLKVHGHTR